MKSKSILLKVLRKSKETTANFLLSALDTSIMSRMVEILSNIVLSLIAVDLFLPMRCDFLELCCKICRLNLEMRWVCSFQYLFYHLLIYERYASCFTVNNHGPNLLLQLINTKRIGDSFEECL